MQYGQKTVSSDQSRYYPHPPPVCNGADDRV